MDPSAVPSVANNFAEIVPLDPATQALVDAAKGAYEQGGWLAVGGLGLMFAVRLLRMTDGGAAWWDTLTTLRKRAFAFGSSALGGGIVIVAVQHASIQVAIPGALISGIVGTIAAGLFHHATEKGAALGKVKLTGNPKIDALLKLTFGHQLEGPEGAPPADSEPPAGGTPPANEKPGGAA